MPRGYQMRTNGGDRRIQERRCLRCGAAFRSAHAGNRICNSDRCAKPNELDGGAGVFPGEFSGMPLPVGARHD